MGIRQSFIRLRASKLLKKGSDAYRESPVWRLLQKSGQILLPVLLTLPLLSVFSACRPEYSQQNSSEVTVISHPSGAEVILGGKYQGTTPVTLRNLPSGTHYAVLKLAGFEPEIFTLDIQDDPKSRHRTYVIERKLEEIQGALLIQTTPAGADVYIDSKKWSTSPCYIMDLSLGEHLIFVQKKGYRSQSRIFSVKDARPQCFEFSLTPEETFDGKAYPLPSPSSSGTTAAAPPAASPHPEGEKLHSETDFSLETGNPDSDSEETAEPSAEQPKSDTHPKSSSNGSADTSSLTNVPEKSDLQDIPEKSISSSEEKPQKSAVLSTGQGPESIHAADAHEELKKQTVSMPSPDERKNNSTQ